MPNLGNNRARSKLARISRGTAMCLFLFTAFVAPRVAIAGWWSLQPGRWQSAFTSDLWPLLGAVFAPWTTLMFVAVAPLGSVVGSDWLFIAIALLLDASIYAGGMYSPTRPKPEVTGSGSP
jgi:hypothetical protein